MGGGRGGSHLIPPHLQRQSTSRVCAQPPAVPTPTACHCQVCQRYGCGASHLISTPRLNICKTKEGPWVSLPPWPSTEIWTPHQDTKKLLYLQRQGNHFRRYYHLDGSRFNFRSVRHSAARIIRTTFPNLRDIRYFRTRTINIQGDRSHPGCPQRDATAGWRLPPGGWGGALPQPSLVLTALFTWDSLYICIFIFLGFNCGCFVAFRGGTPILHGVFCWQCAGEATAWGSSARHRAWYCK